MANYYGTTVSRGGELKAGKKNREAVEAIIAKYSFQGNNGDASVAIGNSSYSNEKGEMQVEVWGEDSISAYKIEDENCEEECFETFLLELAPYLKTALIVQEVGNEKCRYVCAFAWIVKPNAKKVQFVNIEDAIAKLI
jgi:hypothetical protein